MEGIPNSPIPETHEGSFRSRGYRAIHLLSCLGKIMEKMVHTRLVWWMETHNLHMPTQYGFRPGMETIDCLLHLDSLIYQAFKAKKYILIMFIDLEAAFNLSSHIGILYKLGRCNITGNVLMWFQSFLTNRTFSVVVVDTLITLSC